MTAGQAIVLGLTQGATEFLPVSSSGHLVIVPELFGWPAPGVAFDVLLHFGTLAGVIAYFWRDLADIVTGLLTREPSRAASRRLGVLIALATVPTGVIGLALNDLFERLFREVLFVGVFLLVTAVALTAAERLSTKRAHEASSMRWWQVVLIGAAQGAAIAPGISRSGATLATGLGLGLDREQAARFSFLLSVPAIGLAGIWAARELLAGSVALPPLGPTALGFVCAAASGYAAVAGLLAYVRRRALYPFAVYCALVGTGVIVWQLVG